MKNKTNFKKEDFTVRTSHLVQRFGVSRVSVNNWIRHGGFPYREGGAKSKPLRRFHISCLEMNVGDVKKNIKEKKYKDSMGKAPHKQIATRENILEKLEEILSLLRLQNGN